jgi:hypothetical protein
MNDDEPKAGDKIVVANEWALVLARAGNQWLVARPDGMVRYIETVNGIITICKVISQRN